jgi:hypothetical protein
MKFFDFFKNMPPIEVPQCIRERREREKLKRELLDDIERIIRKTLTDILGNEKKKLKYESNRFYRKD